MFVDASAIVAILTSEPDANDLADRLDGASLIVSPIVRYETVMAIARKKWVGSIGGNQTLPASYIYEAEAHLTDFLAEADGSEMPITSEIGTAAIRAMARYGPGTGHPAKLNFGDCFSYACAKAAGVPLLFKGDDFVHTDIESA